MLTKAKLSALSTQVAAVLFLILKENIAVFHQGEGANSAATLLRRTLTEGTVDIAHTSTDRKQIGKECHVPICEGLDLFATMNKAGEVVLWMEGNYKENQVLIATIVHIITRQRLIEGKHIWS